MPLGLLAALLLLIPALLAAQEAPRVLTTTAEVRALSADEARRNHPVKLRGTITYFDSANGHAFLHDETGGIFFRPGRADAPGALTFTPGERVEIQGISWFTRFSPSVAGAPEEPERAAQPGEVRPVKVERLGPGEWPVPATVTLADLRTGAWHDQLVLLRATVRQITIDHQPTESTVYLHFSGPDGQVIRGVLPRTGQFPEQWLNVECTVQAVVAGGGNDRGQLVEVRLLLPSFGAVSPEVEKLEASFRQPASGFGELFRYAALLKQGPAAAPQRVHVDGTVSLARPGEGVFLTNGADGLWVQSPQKQSFAVGDVVSVAGYPQRDDRAPFLTDGILRRKLTGVPPAGRVATAAEAAERAAHGALLTVEGMVVELMRGSGDVAIALRAENGARFLARGGAGALELPQGCATGARLLLTGVCEQPDSTHSVSTPAFTILLRNARDLSVLEHAPWLTPARRGTIFAGVVILAALIGLWVLALRRQVERQTRLIEAQVVQRTLIEERTRLGRELHDTLEQQLAGLHLHLGALSDWLPDAPERVRRTVDAATRMLGHCRSEARRSVLELRSQTLERDGLAGALRELEMESPGPDVPAVEVQVSGPEQRLAHTTEFHLLRCAQESLANALKHAQAGRVLITLEYLPREVRLRVADNGGGFDPAQPPSPGSHLGLQHLRERAGRLKGRCELKTAPGEGTTVTITAPLTPV